MKIVWSFFKNQIGGVKTPLPKKHHLKIIKKQGERQMAKRVIIVDDSRAVIATAELALEGMINSKTIEFKSYLNPMELLGALQNGSENFDLLISDVNMPQLNGLDLARAIKADERYKNKPIIILTTESSNEMKMSGKEIGVTGWMVKPFSDDKLVKSLQMVLGV
jgi:two-component system chemotaxis response regulator CheY